MALLCFVSETAEPIELTERAITVGRDTVNTIGIPNPGISKHHALFIRDGHDYKLFDLHSANGTWVNGQHITIAALKDGDTVRFGPVELRYEGATGKSTSAEATAVAAPTKLAQPSDQPVVSPKKLGIEATGQTPRIRLKRD